MGKFFVKRKFDRRSNMQFYFHGSMDEFADFSQIGSDMTSEVTLDFQKVTHLNSAGIKNWVLWIEKVQAEFPTVTFSMVNCPRMIIQQIEMISNFMPRKAILRSFQVPYYCETCDREETFMYLLGREYEQNPNGDYKLAAGAPEAGVNRACDRKDCAMEMDIKMPTFLRASK